MFVELPKVPQAEKDPVDLSVEDEPEDLMKISAFI
jgi:hypothetical protein